MRKLQYIVLLVVLLCPAWMQAQRRYSAEYWNHKASGGFTSRDVENKIDVLYGLHASQYTGSHHLIGFSVEGGWSAALSNMPSVKMTPGGVATGLRFVYEYQHSGFLLQTGLGLGFHHIANNVADTVLYHEHMHDNWNGQDVEFTLKHSFYDRTDTYQQAYAQLPLYLGHYFFGAQGIGYFLAGIHVNYAFWGSSRLKMTGTTTGLYERYVGVWEEMDNHGFRKDVPIERTGAALKLKLDLMAHAEIGYEYSGLQKKNFYRVRPVDRFDSRVRIAAFADFGILDVSPNTNYVFYETPIETIYDFPTYRFNHAFSTEDAKGFWIRHLHVGVRLTVLFGFQNKERCILCNQWRH